MFAANTPCLCHTPFIYLKLFIIRSSTWLIINICFLSRFEEVKFDVYIYVHIIFDKTLFNLVIFS